MSKDSMRRRGYIPIGNWEKILNAMIRSKIISPEDVHQPEGQPTDDGPGQAGAVDETNYGQEDENG